MDLFEMWLNEENESEWVNRALTDKSFAAYKCREVKKSNPNYDEANREISCNTDLATYGDAVIKLCYLEILLDKTNEHTKEKAKYEPDKYLVNVVGRHYDIIEHIRKDDKDKNLPNSYDYKKYKSKNHNRCKYIATAVEAMIGAIYKETNDLKSIIELLDSWIKMGNPIEKSKEKEGNSEEQSSTTPSN